MKWLNSFAFRFWLAINSLVLTGILAMSGIYYSRESANLENSLKNQGITAANTLNSAIGLYMMKGDYTNIPSLTYSLMDQPNMAYVVVKDINGTIVNQEGEAYLDQNKDNFFIEKLPLEYFQQKVGEVEIGLKTTTLQNQKHVLLSDTLITALILSFMSLVFSYLISRGMTAPLRKLIAATKKMTEGDRNVTVSENGIIEIQELSASFNKMAQTINNHEKILISEINKATKDLSEQMDILEVLANISSSVLEDQVQRGGVLNNTLVSIKKYIKANHISLAFLNNSGHLDIIEINQEGKTNEYELKSSDSTLHMAIKNKEIIVHNNMKMSIISNYEEMLLEKGLQSLLVLPIIAQNKAIGTINIARTNPDYFSKTMIEKLSVFTNQIALALDRVAAYESLQYAAYHDYLTDLPNYRLFKVRVSEAIEKAKDQPHPLLAVMFLDLDRFKTVNDTLGHTTGDLLLIHVGKQLMTCVSTADTVTRIGGDEYSILLPEIKDPMDAVETAKMMINKLEEPVVIKEYEIPISASIGIAYYPNDGIDADNLIKNADRAMYRVKEHGKKNFAIYTQLIDELGVDQLTLENDLRKALDRGEIVVYYQPKINIRTGSLSGLEALVRWRDPVKGLIPPSNFIPQAEENGLIVQIGEYVLREAANQCVSWQSMGMPPIPVSVNLSYRQLLQTNLTSKIEEIIIASKLKPELLELEITESMAIDLERSLDILQDLKGLGVQISVDDFGTGYSSLSYLHRLPVDRVKIDQSFIKDMTLNQSNQTLVSTIINMAHNLNLTVIAEGVESEDQARHLQEHNCDEIQGYYFSKPLPAEEFELKYREILIEAQKWSLYTVN